jgi:hypothetical protein
MVKDEADIISFTLLHLIASGVDGIIIADNASSDSTRYQISTIQKSAGIPIILIDDPERGYYQSQKMTSLVGRAIELSGVERPWLVPFDADELLICNTGETFSDYLRSFEMEDDVRGFEIPMANYFPCHMDKENANPFLRIQHRHKPPNVLPKVIFRASPGMTVQQGNHSALNADGSLLQTKKTTALRIAHFPYRSAEHFIKKSINGGLAYRVANLPEHEGAHWRSYYAAYERGGEPALRDWFERYFYFREDRMGELVLDPVPILGS